ncbi:AbrB/MazE/SpoVT family DNA-binding domain-containing protein [Leptolyngbya sp. 15MV]|nr:AbrB/MazE/SpoVT family DNA-binding domain-containing protein [Leptolyngbya sp. 15MV]
MSSSNAAPVRRAKLFRNGRNQAVRIPVEFELPGQEVLLRREGERLVIEPVPQNSLAALLASWRDLDEDLPEINDPPPPASDDPFADWDRP